MTQKRTICALHDEAEACQQPAQRSGLCAEHEKTHEVVHDPKVCAAAECTGKTFGNGFCKAHYMRDWRIRREKDPEKRKALRAKLKLKIAAPRGKAVEVPQEWESVTIRMTKKTAKRVLKAFPSLYRGGCEIIESWAKNSGNGHQAA
jgi:hypothetical protein